MTPAWGLNATQAAKLLADDGATRDNFGVSVSLDGDTALIGATGDNDNGTRSGSAYVFVRTGGVWRQEAKLLADDGGFDDRFGASVSLDGDTAVIGASFDSDNGRHSGSAYIFVRSGGVWSQEAKLLADDGSPRDHFGTSVSLDGDTALVGAPEHGDSNASSGWAYVFVRSGGVWRQEAKLLPGDGTRNDFFGNSVSLDDDTAFIGAPFDDDRGSASGSVYVFVRSGGLWTQGGKLLAGDGRFGDQFGTAVSVDGALAAIGAVADDSSGSAYVFGRPSGTWRQEAKLVADDRTQHASFGWSVSLDRETAVIGAIFDGDNRTGSAYVFIRSGGVWTQEEKLLADDGSAGDRFGFSVSLDGDNTAIGAVGDGDNGRLSGSAYIFRLAPPDPAELLNDLIDQLTGLGLHHGIENSLTAKLSAALIVLTDLAEGNDHAAENMLGAFINAVEAQRGKHISESDAETLVAAAREIRDLLVTVE